MSDHDGNNNIDSDIKEYKTSRQMKSDTSENGMREETHGENLPHENKAHENEARRTDRNRPNENRPRTNAPHVNAPHTNNKKGISKGVKIALAIYTSIIGVALLLLIFAVMFPEQGNIVDETQNSLTPTDLNSDTEEPETIDYTFEPLPSYDNAASESNATLPPSQTASYPETITIAEKKFIVNAQTALNLRSEPTTMLNNIVKSILPDTIVTAIGQAGSFYKVKIPDGTEGYCHSDYLKAYDETKELYYKAPGYGDTEGSRKNTLVDIRSIDPTIKIDMLLSHSDCWAGKALYVKNAALLQEELAQLLKQAQAKFQEDGYCIVIQDAYRPMYVQSQMFEIVKNNTYVQNPNNPSYHQYGLAIDITLEDRNGNRLEMPTAMHTFDSSASASLTNPNLTPAAKSNLEYMQKVMTSFGFKIYRNEWWHFNPPSSFTKSKYMLVDYGDLRSVYLG